MVQLKDKYVVVTGGAGFIGSALIRELNDRGITRIIVVDNLAKTEKWKNLVGKKFTDIIPKENLFNWLIGKENDIAAFFHLGACSDTTETDCHYLLENNYRYSRRLAEYAIPNNHRFIYASSAATYGDGRFGFSDDHDKLENFSPLNMYGYSKHLFDLWLKRENLLNKVVGIKYFNVFGPNEYHKGKMASAVLKMVPDVLTKGKIFLFKSSEPHLYKDGSQLRDFVYVKDAVRMTSQFLDNDLGGIFNLGSGAPRTWNDLAKAVFQALDQKMVIEYIEMPGDLRGKYQNYTAADMKKSKENRLMLAATPLEDAVKDYVRNYLQQRKHF